MWKACQITSISDLIYSSTCYNQLWFSVFTKKCAWLLLEDINFIKKVLVIEKISAKEEKKRKYKLRHALFCCIN